MSAYSYFAKYYDALTQNVGYRDRAGYFHQLLSRYLPVQQPLVLDLCCGTGSLSLELAALGCDVIGVDASPAMLSVAADKLSESEHSVLFLCQPAEELDLYGTIDACVCALDSVNHFRDERQLREVFGRVSLFTNPGGIFIFDVNTPFKHRCVLADSCFAYDLDEVYVVWQNAYNRHDDSVDISLDFFERGEGATYRRREERFTERIFLYPVLESALHATGFTLLELYGEDSFSQPEPDTQRLIYVAQKNQ